MSKQTFDTKVQSGERGRVFIAMPFDPSEVWGRKARHHVRGTLNGAAFAGSLGNRSGTHFMPVNKDLQVAASAAPGAKVRVVMEPAEANASDLPDDLERALAKAPAARAFFETLSAFYRNTYVKWITEAKKPETRASRVEQTIALLSQKKKQR